MTLWFQDKVDIVESHTVFIRSVHRSFSAPAVLRLRYYIKSKCFRKVRLSRDNIFLRDGHRCQYCGHSFQAKDLTLDHIHPISRGGGNSWQNLTTACHKCNHKKRDRTPDEAGMPLLSKPIPLKWTPQLDMRARIQTSDEVWDPYLQLFTGT